MVFQSETDTEASLTSWPRNCSNAGRGGLVVAVAGGPAAVAAQVARAYALAVIWDQAPRALVVARKAAPC